MTEPIQYPYSVKFSIGSIALMIIFLLMCLSNVLRINDTFSWIVFGPCAVLFLMMTGLLVAKRLVPALNGDISLELDEAGINDYIRDVSIGWNAIEQITFIQGRSASSIQIDLKWESDYGSRIIIPLRWVTGKDREIYETVKLCFEQESGNMIL